MLFDDVRPSTLAGVKRLATQLKKERGIKHTSALELAAKAAQCASFRHAQRVLPGGAQTLKPAYILLTVYWFDKSKGFGGGRETLKIVLPRPILDICKKGDLKRLRGFGTMRMVADDHFVSDELAQSQEAARDRICTAVRSLRFVEQTGLQPSREYRKAYAGRSANTKLPDSDHSTDWVDPTTGQFIVVDEPYRGVPDETKRAAWARRYGWQVSRVTWPGMYYPHHCDLYVATDVRSVYNLDALIAKIEAQSAPLVVSDWAGESAPSLDTFLSPAASTAQDKRRARSRGTIFPKPSAETIPYRMMLGSADRRPDGTPGVDSHIEMGRMIKAVLSSEYKPAGVNRRMDSLRSTLEDWMALEIGRGQLEGPEFFEVYYQENEGDSVLRKTIRAWADVVEILRHLKSKLASAYPDCAPLRRQLNRIDTSVSLIGRMTNRAA